MTISRGDILIVDFGTATGSEQGGTRPAVVIQNDKGNIYSPTILVAPITSRMKKPMPTHMNVGTECGLMTESTILYEQTRVVDKCRVLKEVGHKKMTAKDDLMIAISFGCASFLDESSLKLIRA